MNAGSLRSVLALSNSCGHCRILRQSPGAPSGLKHNLLASKSGVCPVVLFAVGRTVWGFVVDVVGGSVYQLSVVVDVVDSDGRGFAQQTYNRQQFVSSLQDEIWKSLWCAILQSVHHQTLYYHNVLVTQPDNCSPADCSDCSGKCRPVVCNQKNTHKNQHSGRESNNIHQHYFAQSVDLVLVLSLLLLLLVYSNHSIPVDCSTPF